MQCFDDVFFIMYTGRDAQQWKVMRGILTSNSFLSSHARSTCSRWNSFLFCQRFKMLCCCEPPCWLPVLTGQQWNQSPTMGYCWRRKRRPVTGVAFLNSVRSVDSDYVRLYTFIGFFLKTHLFPHSFSIWKSSNFMNYFTPKYALLTWQPIPEEKT